jgi:hypothetical protein
LGSREGGGMGYPSSRSGSGSEEKEKDGVFGMDDERPRSYGDEAAPSPTISRTSRETRERRRLRSAGRGY